MLATGLGDRSASEDGSLEIERSTQLAQAAAWGQRCYHPPAIQGGTKSAGIQSCKVEGLLPMLTGAS